VGGVLLAAQDTDKDTVDNPAFIKQLLALHDKARSLVSQQFLSSPLFQKALKDAFESFVNEKPAHSRYSTCEVLAHYTDHVLTAKDKQQEAELDRELERIVGLFSFVTDKDLFAEVYRSLLCKRLLGGKTQSSDLERSMISKLKLQCGTQYASKLEGMMNDLVGQEKQDKEFREYQDAQPQRPTVDFTVQVLTSGFWPTSVTMPIVLPPALLACTVQFKEWYAKAKTNRVLTWCHAQGTVSIRAAYGSGRSYEFGVNTLQAVVVMLFNDLVVPVGVEALTQKIGTESAEIT
jgi:cullin 1